jgi:signal transduction histidine kinase
MTRILVLVENQQNRRLLESMLSPEYDVSPSCHPPEPADRPDLIIVDGPTLHTRRQDIESLKLAAAPALLPVLLLTPAQGVQVAGDSLVSSVDDLVITPVDKTRLLSRVRALLRIRELTSNLDRLRADSERFAHAISHDLREPLRTMSSYIELLASRYKNKLDQDADEFIAYAVDAAARMQEMISGLLDYVRIGADTGPLAPTDLNDVVKAAVADLSVLIGETGAQIEVGPMPNLNADAAQLARVFQNLIANAIKFRREDPPSIEIRARHDPGCWLVSVSDNGIGIPSDSLTRIFDVFQKLHSRSEYAGTGMGLAICWQTIERHGGRIWVESELGKGSTFFFTLP